jgi:hypothetical protein
MHCRRRVSKTCRLELLENEMSMRQSIAVILMLALAGPLSSIEAAATNPAEESGSMLGDPVNPRYAERTVTLTDDTRYVNVIGGETVRFVKGKREFAWHFNGPVASFHLNQIAPADMLGRVVTVYIAPNPLYFG